jgi:membrane protease YdiL (CAAX protease family)
MQTYLKTRPAWIQLMLFLGMAFGLLMVISLIGIVIYSSNTGISFMELSNPDRWDLNNRETITSIRFMQTLQFFGLFVVPVFLFAYFSDPSPHQYLGLKQPNRTLFWIIGILLMIIAIPLVEYTGILNHKIPFDANTQQWIKSKEEEANKMIRFMLSERTPKQLFLNLIFIALTAGIGEELFFRGILQRLFIRMFNSPWVGIILTAILFSAIHMQFMGFIPRVIMGILLGAIYWYSGSLWVAIFAHFFYDAILIVIAYFNPQILNSNAADASIINTSSLAVLALISAILVALLLWQMKKASVTRYDDIYRDDFKPKDEFSF